MAQKKYISVDPNDGLTSDLARMVNPTNEYWGKLVTVNPTDPTDMQDVRNLFVARVRVNGSDIRPTTDNSQRVVDVTPHIELNPVSGDGEELDFSEWECLPERTHPGEATDDNPYPDRRISMRQRSDGKWVATVVIQEGDWSHGVQEVTEDITIGKGSGASMRLEWSDSEIRYGSLSSITASRQCDNLLGYRLGVDGGINDGKLLQPAHSQHANEPYFDAWKNGTHEDGLCAGDGAKAYTIDYAHGRKVIVPGGVAIGRNATVVAEGAIQLGSGTNSTPNTLRFMEWELVDGSGKIPDARLDTDASLMRDGAAADAGSVGRSLASMVVSQALDAPYDQGAAYEVGDTCTRGGRWWKCIHGVDAGSAWDSGDWMELTVKDAIHEGVTIDDTLSQRGAAADAKAVGDALLTVSCMGDITWSELKSLRDTGELVPGRQYRITDYVATVNGECTDATSAHHPFDVIVTADSASTLSECARAAVSASDASGHFDGCSVEAWQVWYCLDNDTHRFEWADPTNGRGVIYRLIDEFRNDLPYDFKGIVFRAYGDTDNVWRYTFDSGETRTSDVWNLVNANNPSEIYEWQGQVGTTYNWSFGDGAKRITFDADRQRKWLLDVPSQGYAGQMRSKETELSAKSIRFINASGTIVVKRDEVWSDGGDEVEIHNTDLSLSGAENMVYGNTVCPYTVAPGDSPRENRLKLNRIVFKGRNCHSNALSDNCRDTTFSYTCCSNTFGIECYRNIFDHGCSANHLGDYCFGNSFGYNCVSNRWGDTCGVNIFGYGCKNNTFESECQGIVLGDLCIGNRFGRACSQIGGGNLIQFCDFGDSVLGVYFGSSTMEGLESGFSFVEIGDAVRMVNVKCTVQGRDPANAVRYVTVGCGVSSKAIEIGACMQTHHTTYRMADEETISI